MQTYKISEYKYRNEIFTIESVDHLDGLDHLKNALTKSGKEIVRYNLKRVVSGKKKSYTVGCWRSVKTGIFTGVV